MKLSTSLDALSAKGFRVFFLAALAYSALIIPLWLLALGGRFLPSGYLDPVGWHAHEMLFGYTAAVIAGFLLTAVSNWTQRETLTGRPLIALATLWLCGRAALTLGSGLPRWLVALVDALFLPLLLVAVARPILAARSRRNYGVLFILAALSASNAAVHLDALGLLHGARARANTLALDLIVLVILLITGRVVPLFTRNATGAASVRSIPLLDRLTLAAMSLLALADLVAPASPLAPTLAGVTALCAAARSTRWGASLSARDPLLWVLHLGHAWIPLALLLRALDGWTHAVPSSVSVHALTAGAIGALTLGMMVRVSLGHTGRKLVASRWAAVAFVALSLAAVARVAAPSLSPARVLPALMIAGALWSLAFTLALIAVAPALIAPRVDGRPG